MTDQKLRMRMLRQVALRADGFYPKAESLGRKAAEALTKSKRAQITGLESIANSALKTTDVFDFIKTRVARHKEWREQGWGPELLRFLSRDLGNSRKQVCSEIDGLETESIAGIEVHLMLIREFVRQLAAQYEYACEFPDTGGER